MNAETGSCIDWTVVPGALQWGRVLMNAENLDPERVSARVFG